MKFKNILFIASLLFSYFLPVILHQTRNISNWLDALFLVGLLLIVIHAIMLLIEAEFFVAFIKSFKHFFARVNKKEQVIRESEKHTNHTIVYRKSFPTRKYFFEIGILFCSVSLLVSSIIYYFGR